MILANEMQASLDICKYIRLDKKLSFLPFLYIIKNNNFENIKSAYHIGANECIKTPINLDETLLRIRKYIENYTALKKCLLQSEKLALYVSTDKLTKISNNMHMQTLLLQSLKEYERYDKVFSIVYFRIEDMQQINSLYGFTIGDKLLKDVAQFVAKSIRTSDVIARWGGGDFVILTPHTSLEFAKHLIKKLHLKLLKETFISDLQIKVNFGITQVVKEDTVALIIGRAKQSIKRSATN
ncbi:diguanylate cyclase domain-containing protein [Sulfurimonas sp.]